MHEKFRRELVPVKVSKVEAVSDLMHQVINVKNRSERIEVSRCSKYQSVHCIKEFNELVVQYIEIFTVSKSSLNQSFSISKR